MSFFNKPDRSDKSRPAGSIKPKQSRHIMHQQQRGPRRASARKRCASCGGAAKVF